MKADILPLKSELAPGFDSQPIEDASAMTGLDIEEVDEAGLLPETPAEVVDAALPDLAADETVEMPDWMMGLDEASDEPVAALVEDGAPAAAMESGEESADWLSELQAEAMEVEAETDDEAALPADLPAWMNGLDDATARRSVVVGYTP